MEQQTGLVAIHTRGDISMTKSTGQRERHGLGEHPLYSVWKNMKARCSDVNRPDYERYGARGINVCEPWKKSFYCFYVWALSNGYKEGLQIDRSDNEKGYYEENCRWVTNAENCRNRRSSKLKIKDVLEIKSLLRKGVYQRTIAKMFGLCQATVKDINIGKIWKGI
jgi:hypothetical protein